MNPFLEVETIELDLEIFNKPKIVLRRQDGSVVKIFKVKKGKEQKALQDITSKWLKEIDQHSEVAKS